MGEGRLSGGESRSNRRLTVPEAAATLGITEAAVRGRIKRGTLRSYREEGAVFVVMIGGESSSNRDESRDESRDQSELVAVLREQLAAEREANRENRRLLAAALERIPPQLEPPRDEPGATETGAETSESASPRSAAVGTQTDAEEHAGMPERPTEETARRPWWVRVFGG